jgi:hypothetical protein
MGFLNVNFLAVFVCGIVYLAIGGLWFGPVFGKPWMELRKAVRKKNGPKPDITFFIPPFLFGVIAAYVLGLLMRSAGAVTLMSGAGMGLLVGLGFEATFFGSSFIFYQKPFRLYLIDTGAPIVYLIASGMILGIWH